ncbi:MAG TPA: N-6 DNA methylase [Planktothrix sp.]
MRRLAALVGQCRREASAASASRDTAGQLSDVLFSFAMQLLHHWQLHEAFSQQEHSNPLSALFARLNSFAPEGECAALPPPDATAVERCAALIDASELKTLWSHPCLLGYVYQFFSLAERKQSQRAIQTANKVLSRGQIVSFTQLYTPSWVVEFLLGQTLSYALALPTVSQPVALLDPACGSGHFLIPAFDRLVEHHAGNGSNRSAAARTALSQLFGADIDGFALAALSLSTLLRYVFHAREFPDQPWNNVANVNTSLLGSLDRSFADSHFLSRKYLAVVTNPPYIGRKLMSREMKQSLKKEYPAACSDLSAPFVVRGLELLDRCGRLGLITQSSILSLPSYTELRRRLVVDSSLVSAVELGSGVFPLQTGEKVNSVLLVAEATPRQTDNAVTEFRDLTDSDDKENDLLNPSKSGGNKVYLRDSSVFLKLANVSFQYRAPSFLFDIINQCSTLNDVADVRQGLATTDNQRFVKYWWEVRRDQIGTVWYPYIKGAGTQRWSSPVLHVVNFADNGREIKQAVVEKYPYLAGKSAWVVKNEQYYFRPGLCFSFVSTEQFAVRLLPAGCIFDVAASAIFIEEGQRAFLLGYLNSTLMRAMSKLYNPTINVQVGDVKRLPLFTFDLNTRESIAATAERCAQAKDTLNTLFSPCLHWRSLLLNLEEFQTAPEQTALNSLHILHQAQQQLRHEERELDRLILDNCVEMKRLRQHERKALIDWLQDETTGERRDAEGFEAFPCTAIDIVDGFLLRAALEIERYDTTGGVSWSPALIHWIESVCKQSITQSIEERLSSCAKTRLYKRPPADWQQRIDWHCQRALAAKEGAR